MEIRSFIISFLLAVAVRLLTSSRLLISSWLMIWGTVLMTMTRPLRRTSLWRLFYHKFCTANKAYAVNGPPRSSILS